MEALPMGLYSGCYRYIYECNRHLWEAFLTTGLPPEPNWTISLDVIPKETVQGKIVAAAEARWPAEQLIWKRLGNTLHKHVVLYIKDRYVVMRNGSNQGSYNYVIIDRETPAQLHWAMKVSEALDTVKLLDATKDELPLWIGMKLKPKLTALFERKCKGV